MIARFQFLHAAAVFDGARCRAVTAAVLLVAAQTYAAQASAASRAAASAPAVASAPVAASQVTVQAGQSLNDVAIAITQSHDRAVLARAARAIFDANPSAFMKNDPSRMKIGAVLNVPALDATGALAGAAASSAVVATAAAATATASGVAAPAGAATMTGNAARAPAASAATAATAGASAAQEAREQAGSAAAGVSATGAATGAATSASAATAAAATGTTSASAVAAATSASAATTANAASTPAAASASAAAATPASASAATPVSAASPVVQAAGASASQAAAASNGNVWSGSIQSAPGSQPAAGASGAQAASASAPQPASPARAQVSSLQQLLALKNRVLMELQKHGIGRSAGTPQAASGAAASNGLSPSQPGASPATGPSAARAHSPVAPAASQAPQQLFAPTLLSKQEYVGLAALIGAALAALVAGLAMRRRKRSDASATATLAASAQDAAHDGQPAPAVSLDTGRRGASAYDAMAKAGESTTSHEISADDADDVPSLTERVPSAADDVAPQLRHASERPTNAPTEGVTQTAGSGAGAAAAAGLAAAAALDAAAVRDESSELTRERHDLDSHEHHAGDRVPIGEPFAAPADRGEHGEPEEPPAAEADAVAHESATPATPELPPDIATLADAGIDSAHSITDAPADEPEVPSPPVESVEPTEPTADEAQQPQPDEPQPPSALPSDHELLGTEPDENRATLPQFPRAALDAFDSLDLSLPPRGETGEPVTPPASLTTQPVVEPEITAQQAVPPHEPESPRVGEQIEAGTAGHGAIAGMGAAKYGPLALDFDLELPASPAQPLPTFTPQELARIARNKLELAAEYIELGDVAGARTLINEVIESNDAATSNEARAMLSTLAPLS
ncbi:FimV/HubP family polar landmark protein [Paraburkholderia solisilvae]|uniref:FimV C-terminal domain-containing protein n=1 Tax=Paraburkholderia solisilvae TaxID=624376 RepID=A0A6J5DU16_9BURK|nr:FimV/HubP family polar landmark protein [Paraburkholderia solisilvae]CAB3757423.1 hypothetical protein LMG29739_02695 [Paraburkholderia solisilvae]